MIIKIETIEDFIECYQKANIKQPMSWWKNAAGNMTIWEQTIQENGSDAMKAKYLGNYKPRKVINA